jgi:eukaryotic-like serine/threonine-protein kinase
VTNKALKEFVNQGGYQKREYWKEVFVRDGRVLNWEEAGREFVDQTGRPGPATWYAGNCAQGHDDHPVSGISWCEAAAFAKFAKKDLPTASHWDIARGGFTPLIQSRQFLSLLFPLSNFNSQGTVIVGSKAGVTAYGAYDMAGNVREYCAGTRQKRAESSEGVPGMTPHICLEI